MYVDAITVTLLKVKLSNGTQWHVTLSAGVLRHRDTIRKWCVGCIVEWKQFGRDFGVMETAGLFTACSHGGLRVSSQSCKIC